MRTTAAPNAFPRRHRLRRDVLAIVRDVLVALAVVAAVLYLMPLIFEAAADDVRRDPGFAALPRTDTCSPPTEHEQLHIVVVVRGDGLVTECRYVGPRGAFRRTPHGAPEVRP